MLTHKVSVMKMGDSSFMKFVVTIINMSAEPFDFGDHLLYQYKSRNDGPNFYQKAPYYMEATDMNGFAVYLPDFADIGRIYDSHTGNGKNINKIVDTVWTGIYTYRPGKYRVRWVYDPANVFMSNKPEQKPIYSNWETIEVTK